MDEDTEALQRFWSQLTDRLEEGWPLLPALGAVADECGSPGVSAAARAVAEKVAAGLRLSDALATQPAFFGPGAVCIIRGGEYLGLLAGAARFVADASLGCPTCAAWRGDISNTQ